MKSLYQSDLRTLIIDEYGTGLPVSRILAHEFPAQTGMGPSRARPIGLRRSSPSPKPGPENRAEPGDLTTPGPSDIFPSPKSPTALRLTGLEIPVLVLLSLKYFLNDNVQHVVNIQY